MSFIYFRHSDIKEFECDECGKQFKRKDKLKEHAKRMHQRSIKNENASTIASSYIIPPNVVPLREENDISVPGLARPKKKKKSKGSAVLSRRNDIETPKGQMLKEKKAIKQDELTNGTNASTSSTAIPGTPPTKKHIPKVKI